MRKQLAFPGQTRHRKLGQFVNLRIVEKITEDGADVRYVIRTDDKRICLRNDGRVFDTSGKHIGDILMSPEEYEKLDTAFKLNNGIVVWPEEKSEPKQTYQRDWEFTPEQVELALRKHYGLPEQAKVSFKIEMKEVEGDWRSAEPQVPTFMGAKATAIVPSFS